MGTNTQGRTCEHDRGYYGYVDSSTGDCPYCKLRTMEAENAKLEAKVKRLKREKVEAQSKAFHAEAKVERLEAENAKLKEVAQAVVDAKRGHFNLPNSLAMEIEALAELVEGKQD